MKKMFALALLLTCLTAVPLSTQSRPMSGKCTYVLLDSHLDAAGCVIEHYLCVCSSGQGSFEIEMKTCS